MSADQAQETTDEMSDSAMESAQASASDTFDDGELGDDETPGEATRPNAGAPTCRAVGISSFRAEFDETVGAEQLCDEEELDRLRAFSTSSLPICRASSARLANRLQRRLMAQQNRSWDFDLEEGFLDPARLARIVIDPDAAAVLQAGARHRSSATPW